MQAFLRDSEGAMVLSTDSLGQSMLTTASLTHANAPQLLHRPPNRQQLQLAPQAAKRVDANLKA